MKRLAVMVIGLGIVLSSVGCFGRAPTIPGLGSGSSGGAAPGGAERPASGGAGSGSAADRRGVAESAPAATPVPAAEPAAEPAATAVPAAREAATLSDTAYKDAVTPLMRRLRENGMDSLNAAPISSCSGVDQPRRRLVNLREQLNEIENSLNDLANPSGLQRAQDELGRSVRTQKEAHDLQIEAMDNCSNRSTMMDRLQRSQSRLLDARNAWEEARRTLNVNP